jgi:hypothetical protein
MVEDFDAVEVCCETVVACVELEVCDCSTVACHSQLTLYIRSIPNAVCRTPTEDEQVMLETCTGPRFSINWMKCASHWFHYTDMYGIWWSGVNLLKFETSLIQRLLSYMPFLSYIFRFLELWNSVSERHMLVPQQGSECTSSARCAVFTLSTLLCHWRPWIPHCRVFLPTYGLLTTAKTGTKCVSW